MIKSELATILIGQYPHLYHREADRIVHTIFETIGDVLQKGGRVELRGFGTFSVRQHPARQGRNPKTGERIRIEAKHAIFFRPSKKIYNRLNPQ